jgi:transposase
MGSIIKKKIKGKTYYYYVESKRVNGKPKLVNQKYLGTAERLLERLAVSEHALSDRVIYSDNAEFGAVMLLYDIATRLGLHEIIDGILLKRKQGAPISAYILTAAINRATDPSSKSALAEWYANSHLPSVMGYKSSVFSSQNFWNNTSISAHDLDRIEAEILEKMLSSYQIDTSHIIYDATNFFTYIDTMQEGKLARRGHSKEKRNDLRVVGLSMMVSPDFAIPLLYEAYPGNRADAKEFPIMLNRLKTRYEALTSRSTDITIVFDRGNNSEANIDLLESGDIKVHYVGGLKRNQAKELYVVDRSEYTALSGTALQGQSAYRRQMEVYGRMLTVLIVHNPELEEGQLQGILLNLSKAEDKLAALQQSLIRRANGEVTKGKKPTFESVTCAVKKILKIEYMNEIFRYEVTVDEHGVHLNYEQSETQLDKIRKESLGKTVLFTDRSDFSNEQIITAYRSAWHIEAAFRQMKNPHHLAVRPMFHWTDDKIRVHIFICMLAYRLCSLLQKELFDSGISASINRLLDEMASIRKITTFFGDINKPDKVESFTNGTELAREIDSIYRLKAKYS